MKRLFGLERVVMLQGDVGEDLAGGWGRLLRRDGEKISAREDSYPEGKLLKGLDAQSVLVVFSPSSYLAASGSYILPEDTRLELLHLFRQQIDSFFAIIESYLGLLIHTQPNPFIEALV